MTKNDTSSRDHYRKPITITLSPKALAILEELKDESGDNRSRIVERVLRSHAKSSAEKKA